MKIGVTSQNFHTITGHAGITCRLLVYSTDADTPPVEIDRLDLPKEMTMHELRDMGPHPFDSLDMLITAGCGMDFLRRMTARGIEVVATSESNHLLAVTACASGIPLSPPEPHSSTKH